MKGVPFTGSYYANKPRKKMTQKNRKENLKGDSRLKTVQPGLEKNQVTLEQVKRHGSDVTRKMKLTESLI